jgi:cytidyltransferase-like protein
VRQIVVAGSYDDLRSWHVRVLQEAPRLGSLDVLLWSDQLAPALGSDVRSPEEERLHVLDALRYVDSVSLLTDAASRYALPHIDGLRPEVWAVKESEDSCRKRSIAASHGMAIHVLPDGDLAGLPELPPDLSLLRASRKRVVVTGCFDWFHSGHGRFFEETSELGDLWVVVGHEENVRLLKGEGHPLFSQAERRYMVQSVRHVKRALVSTGRGWMDAEPEIDQLKLDIDAVNQDGDKPEKRAFCQDHGLEYVVLERRPREGLPRRTSTNLRGF